MYGNNNYIMSHTYVVFKFLLIICYYNLYPSLMSKTLLLVSLFFGVLVDPSIPIYHLNLNFLLYMCM